MDIQGMPIGLWAFMQQKCQKLDFVVEKNVFNSVFRKTERVLKGNSSPKSFFAYWLVLAQRRGRSNVFLHIEEEVSKTVVRRSPFLALPWPHECLTSSTQLAPVSSCSKQEDQCVDRRVVDFERGFHGLVCGFWLLQWWKKKTPRREMFLCTDIQSVLYQVVDEALRYETD